MFISYNRKTILLAISFCVVRLGLGAPQGELKPDTSNSNEAVRILWKPEQMLKYGKISAENQPKPFNLIFTFPVEKIPPRYYNPRNVIPENPLMLDYRHHSYYTPKMVQDKLDLIMNRPRSDSFVPLPSLALLTASVALQYINLKEEIEIKASDYAVNKKYWPVLLALWQESPLTAEDIYKRCYFSDKRSFTILEKELEHLTKQKLVRKKLVEKASDQYFASQSAEQVKFLLKDAAQTEKLSLEQTQLINDLLQQIKTSY